MRVKKNTPFLIHPEKSNPPATIYTLSLDGIPFYVGRTFHPLKQRLDRHKMSNGRMGSKFMKGEVVIEAIDHCELAVQSKIEKYWISQLTAWGFKLINVQHVKPSSKYLHKRSYDSSHIKFSAAEIDLILALHSQSDIQNICKPNKFVYSTVRGYLVNFSAPIHYKIIIMRYFLDKGYALSKKYYRAAFEV